MAMYDMKNTQTRWISFENPSGEPKQAAKSNKGLKGNAYETIAPHQTKTLCNYDGCGVINRIWMTLGALDPKIGPGMPSDAIDPKILRSLRIDMYWDGAQKPAVSAPLGDFFGTALGIRTPFESALFSDPEGRSFNCMIKMPFKKNARIEVTHDGEFPATVIMYYKVSMSLVDSHGDDMLYFHTFWNRETPKLGDDYTMLPKIEGTGRYLGANIGIIADERYQYSWWGEGEIKLYLDGDTDYPTLAGTGTEDYPGSGYGLGCFGHLYQGCTHAEGLKNAFYRYHIEDPIYFQDELRVIMPQIGSAPKSLVMKMVEIGAPLLATSGVLSKDNTIFRFMEEENPYTFDDERIGDNDTLTFLRVDDWSSTVYFYLDKSESDLPVLPDVSTRI